MTLFGRLRETILGYLTQGDTPRNQMPLHRAVTRQSHLNPPQINVNGKRALTPLPDSRVAKRCKIPDGYQARPSDMYYPGYHPSDEDDESSSDDDYPDYGVSEEEYESDLADEGQPLTENTPPEPTINAIEATPASEKSELMKQLAMLDTPEYKRRLAQDKTIIQPNQEFDEADLKELGIQRAYEKRRREGEIMRRLGWADDPIKLYLKLTMRGWEPLFPITWKLSFDSFPQVLFCHNHGQAYIKSLSSKEFRAMKAFRSLVMVGSRARDATLDEVTTPPSRQPQSLIHREVKNYMKWAFADADVSDEIPTLAVISGDEEVDPEVLERKMVKRLTELKERWIAALSIVEDDENGEEVVTGLCSEPPTMYGIIISNLMLCLVALEDQDDGLDEPRIHAFSWNNMAKPEYDVWTTISIAIVIMHCRSAMQSTKELMLAYDEDLEDYMEALAAQAGDDLD